MRNCGIAMVECPTWIRRRWHAAVKGNYLQIFDLFVDFCRRTASGELTWR